MIDVKKKMAMIVGGACGVMTPGGRVVAFKRRFVQPARLRATGADILIPLPLLMVQCVRPADGFPFSPNGPVVMKLGRHGAVGGDVRQRVPASDGVYFPRFSAGPTLFLLFPFRLVIWKRRSKYLTRNTRLSRARR